MATSRVTPKNIDAYIYALIERIVKLRLKQNLAQAAAKGKTGR